MRFSGGEWRTVVGVAGDVHHEALGKKPAPEMYVPYGQVPNVDARPTIVLRTSIDPASVTSALRKAVSEVDANVPLDQIETMRQIVSGSVAQSRFRTALLGICIGLVGAALLARLIASLLFGVAPFDRATIASVSVLLVVVALVACYIPAQRAAKADPMDSLRYE